MLLKWNKKWIAAIVVTLGVASMQSEQVYARSYLTDEIGEGSVFRLDPHLQSLKSGSKIFFQEGHTVVVTDIDPLKPFCKLSLKSNEANHGFVVHFANAASPHWFFNDQSELECRGVETEEDLTSAVQGLVSVEKHRDQRVIAAESSKG